VLSCDVNTRGHTQWFLFRVRGMQAGVHYRFHFINLMKPDSLFSSGMRPLLYSEQVAAETGVGWTRCADEIAYFVNQYTYSSPPKKTQASTKGAKGGGGGGGGGSGAGAASASSSGGGAAAASTAEPAATLSSYYTLTFRLEFPRDDDVAYVSQCYPYTYSMAQQFTARLLQEKRAALIRREALCVTVGGNACDLLSVTDFTSSPQEVASRRVIVISARVHPGETNASWMMHGLLEALTSDSSEARQLRHTVMVKIIPMLNPDGVILGNYRCSLPGVDLNRQWAEPHESSHPTIHHMKRMMRSLQSTDQLLLFCDLHGHSRKRNVFCYGCENPRGPHRLRERLFPRLLADHSPHFSLGACSFKVLRSKESTGRVVVWRQLSQPSSFTLEASFCGADFGAGAGGHYSIANLKQMGAAFVPALLDYVEPSQARVAAIFMELESQFPLVDEEGDDAADADGEGGGGGGKGGGGDGSEASDKLRRAARGTRARGSGAPASSSSSSSSSGGKGAAAAGGKGGSGGGGKKGGGSTAPAESTVKKKKKAAATGGGERATAGGGGAGGGSPRNTRSPH
jgi:hypothetical protein